MYKIFTIILVVFLCSSAFAQSLKGIQKIEAIQLAKAWAESSHPPVDLQGMNAQIVFVERENQWIVRFIEPSSPNITRYMLRVEAISGHNPQFVMEPAWNRYEQYFYNYNDSK